MKNVLMLTFSWPPRPGTGTWRPLKFAKYLPSFGWTPTVLTARGWGRQDRRFLPAEGWDGCRALDVMPWGDDLLARWISWPLAPLAAALGKNRTWLEETLAWRTRRWLTYPTPGTDFNRWILPFVAEALRHVRSGKYDVVYVTSPPDCMALAAGLLSRLTLVPMVIDFRDPWSQNFEAFYTGVRHRLSRILECWSIRHAARLVTVTEKQATNLAELSPASAGKIKCISNGFDHEDIPPASVYQRGPRCVVALMGTSYDRWEDLFEAIRRCAESSAEFARQFTFLWMGVNHGAETAAREAGVEENVELLPPVPHDEALLRAAQSDALWLEGPMKPGADYVTRSKTYEYLALGRPIIGTATADTALRTLAERASECRLITSRDPADIADLLMDTFTQWQRGDYRMASDADYIAQFRRDVLTGKLAKLLDEIA